MMLTERIAFIGKGGGNGSTCGSRKLRRLAGLELTSTFAHALWPILDAFRPVREPRMSILKAILLLDPASAGCQLAFSGQEPCGECRFGRQ